MWISYYKNYWQLLSYVFVFFTRSVNRMEVFWESKFNETIYLHLARGRWTFLDPAGENEIDSYLKQPDDINVCQTSKGFYPIDECKIQFLHQENDPECFKRRQLHLNERKKFFQITDPALSSIDIDFFSSQIDFHKILPTVPWLNRTAQEAFSYFSFSDEDARYTGMFAAYLRYLNKVENNIRDGFFMKLRNQTWVPSSEVYQSINNAFQNQVQKLHTSHATNPCFERDCTSKLKEKGWPESDRYFVQRRLAGPCPFSLKKVTINGLFGMSISDLKTKINWNFDYDLAVTEAYGSRLSFEEAIKQSLLFVLYHPQHDDVTSLHPEFLVHEDRKLKELKNPISFFVLGVDGEFKIVSIQSGSTPSDPVLKSSSSDAWLKVKTEVELADLNMCHGFYHAGKIHIASTIYCLAFRRNIDRYHPLYDFLLHHCEGTIQHISLVYAELLLPAHRADKMLAMGHEGFRKLGKLAYDQRNYGEFDMPTLIKNSGLDDDRIKYYPFREDGLVIWEELAGFTNDVVEKLYSSDDDVITDKTLQDLASELSPNGLGKMTGFPDSFQTKQELRLFLLRLIWNNVIHTVANYPLNMYNHIAIPTKLFNNNDNQPFPTFFQTLPDLYTAVNVSSFIVNIANFRANRILDYHNQIRHEGLKQVVTNSYNRFRTCVQEKLSRRNADRRAKQDLAFEYLEPKYLTNSVHI